MTNTEAIETLKVARAEVEWEYPIGIAAAIDLAISALERERWISVEERSPEPKYAVLGYAPRYGNIFALYYDSVCGWMVWSPISDEILPASQGNITHWKPLPEPPKEET